MNELIDCFTVWVFVNFASIFTSVTAKCR